MASHPAAGANGATILVIDDKDDTRDAIVAYLEYEGFQVREALDGTSALEALRGALPDLVLLDGMMPDMDGLDVLQAIRETPRSAHLPVIMVTARGETSDVVRGFKIGANDYLIKPVQLEVLVKRVQTLLRLQALERLRTTLSERLWEMKDLIEGAFGVSEEGGEEGQTDPVDQRVRDLRGIIAEMIALSADPEAK